VYETPDDINRLQTLLDVSYERSGAHMRSILAPHLRLTATEVCETLTAMELLVLATAGSNGEPRTGPVDGLFFRGQFWFGSSPASVRVRHIRSNPAVSATHPRGESLVVVVHGQAAPPASVADLLAAQHPFTKHALAIYGPDWANWSSNALYTSIGAHLMFASRLPSPASE